MRFITAEEVDRALTHAGLVETLRAGFRKGAVQPLRHHHAIERPQGAASTLLLMPAWSDFASAAHEGAGHIGVKIVTVSPDNNKKNLPAIMGVYLLLDGETGEPKALIDGQRLTLWRTACASALAADYLARRDAEMMLMVGAGALAPFLVRAHAAVRPIKRVAVWNRTPANAERLAEQLRREGVPAEHTPELDDAVRLPEVAHMQNERRQQRFTHCRPRKLWTHFWPYSESLRHYFYLALCGQEPP
jgi:ornithine cyclodeaminase/alanine dehydrogenase-like protein (mu-crystallin family)